jgi:low affinity Fe/Cu permease
MAAPDDAVDRQRSDGVNAAFATFASWASDILGKAWVFLLAALVILVWALSGPLFGFSATWQLVINTGTTIVTFLMVFIIQNTQNRDARATHIKLDELLRAVAGARGSLADAEDRTDEELQDLKKQLVQDGSHGTDARPPNVHGTHARLQDAAAPARGEDAYPHSSPR